MRSSVAASGRLVRSAMPPGGNGLMMVIGRFGNASWAVAAPTSTTNATTIARTDRIMALSWVGDELRSYADTGPPSPRPSPSLRGEGRVRGRSRRRGSDSLPLSARAGPDAALVHQADLALDHLVPVLLVFHRRSLEVQVLRVDRLLVQELIELGPQVLHPVVLLRPRPVVAERLDVDHP